MGGSEFRASPAPKPKAHLVGSRRRPGTQSPGAAPRSDRSETASVAILSAPSNLLSCVDQALHLHLTVCELSTSLLALP